VLPDGNAYKEFQDQEIRIEYKGTLSGDEIKFTRRVGGKTRDALLFPPDGYALSPLVKGAEIGERPGFSCLFLLLWIPTCCGA
jgi:hypothetical protein